MHFLITNDDGISCDGIAALESAARALGIRVSVVAPATEQSMCGHRVTTHSPLRVERLAEGRYTVEGTPADCVRIALFGLDLRPDFVVSGINHGGNLGQDLVISGTVAAAREAAYHGVPAAAFSHYIIGGIEFDWTRAGQWVQTILGGLIEKQAARGTYWNVNLPHLPPGAAPMPPMHATLPARSPLNVAYTRKDQGDGLHLYSYASRYGERPQDKDSDVAVCFGGAVSISELSV
jgi:5'-nucleotidase